MKKPKARWISQVPEEIQKRAATRKYEALDPVAVRLDQISFNDTQRNVTIKHRDGTYSQDVLYLSDIYLFGREGK